MSKEEFERRFWAEIADDTSKYLPKEEREQKTTYTVEEFSEEFLKVYVRNNNKHSVIITKRSILNNHLLPFLGKMSLCRSHFLRC